MAALDWLSRADALRVLSTQYLEEDVVDALLADLVAIGEPYDDVYSSEIDDQKARDLATYAGELSGWETTTEGEHDQTYKAINFAEDLLSLARTTPVSFDPSVEASNYAKAALASRLGVLANRAAAAAAAGSLPHDLGLRDIMTDYRTRIVAAYDARPVQSYTGVYGVDRLVPVPTLGKVTVAKTEELLQALMDKADEIVDLVNFVP